MPTTVWVTLTALLAVSLTAPAAPRATPSSFAAGAVVTPRHETRQQRAAELTQRGVDLLTERKLDEALAELDRAIEEDESYWAAWYQRGRCLANMNRMEEAKESLLQATVLNPGHMHAHQLTALAAQLSGDYEVAWDHGIRAFLAGADAGQVFDGLRELSEQPADFDERTNAWKVYVVGVDTRDLLASADLPDRGGSSGVNETLNEIQADLILLQRLVANAISDSYGFGLVQQPDAAQYLLTISPDTIDSTPRPTMEGRLRLFEVESNDAVYSRQIEFRDLSSVGSVTTSLQQVVNQMEEWRRERR